LELLCAESAQVRLDACHLLGLSGNSASRPALSVLLQDPDPEVREEARDSLDNLAALD
jgi:HEAT repeat protein